jgi:hypothetical protein
MMPPLWFTNGANNNLSSMEGVCMKNVVASACLVVLLASLAFAQEGKPVTLKGYVVDQMCAKGIAKKENMMEKAAGHTRQCALEENCAESGYGMFSEGKWYKFDDKGSAKAKGMIEKSKREKGLYFEAMGKVEGDTFVLSSLKEATAEQKAEKSEKKG